MKPKIQLVSGCTTSFKEEKAVNSGNDSSAAILKGNEAESFLDNMLVTIIKSLAANAGILRILSFDKKEYRSIAIAGLPDYTSQIENIIESGCGVCGEAMKTNLLASSNSNLCRKRHGPGFFDATSQFVIAVPLEKEQSETTPDAMLTLFFATEPHNVNEIKRTIPPYAQLIHIALMHFLQQEQTHQNNLLTERQSIANEIHDSLAQTLYYAKIRASLLIDAMKSDNDLLAYKCAQDINEALDGSQKTVRELVTHFRCQMDPRGLKFALEKLAEDFISRTNICLLYDNQLVKINLPLEYELQIFLIVREALVNIATHSGAKNARLAANRSYNQYQFTVEDDGTGMGNGMPLEGHYGLEIMRERALKIGGTVEVENLEKLGTRVQLIFSAPVV